MILRTTKTLANPISEFIDRDRCWFDYKYEVRLGCRHETFKRAFYELLNNCGTDRVVVETGCVREKDDFSAGYSTYLIGELLSWYGGHLDTIDINKKNIAMCRKVTKEFSDVISYHTQDSVHFLSLWPSYSGDKKIDLLYLDSYDYPGIPKEDVVERSQQHCLAELKAALPSLH